MDPTEASEREDDRKARAVSEILRCRHERAREFLASCGGDVNKVIDTFFGSKVSVAVSKEVKMTSDSPGAAGGISSVLKRKMPEWGNKNEEYKKINVLPSRNFDIDSEQEREFRIAEGHFLRMVRRKRNYEIKSIDIVHNQKLKNKFDQKKQEFKMKGLDNKPLLIFHGTPQKNIEHILRENFDLKKVANGRKYGDGVYFSEVPEVSLKYSKDQSSLILCLVLQGDNTKEIKIPQTGVQAKDIQNSMSGAFAIVVPDVDQILPKYVINFTNTVKPQPVLIPPLNLPTSSSGSAKTLNTAFHLAAGSFARPAQVQGFSALPAPVPGISAPTVSFPGFSAPTVSFPGFSAPTVSFPGFSAPTVSFPGFSPTASFPGFSAPTVSSGFSAPGFSAPSVSVPGFLAPTASAPGFSVPTVSAPGFSGRPYSAPAFSAPPVPVPGLSAPTVSAPGFSAPTVSAPGLSVPTSIQFPSQTANSQSSVAAQISQPAPVAYTGQVGYYPPYPSYNLMPQIMAQMSQNLSWMFQTISGMQQAGQQNMSGMPHAVSGMLQSRQQIVPQATPVVQQAMPGMPQIMSQMPPLTQLPPPSPQPPRPNATVVAHQLLAAARQAQRRSIVNSVAGKLTAQAKAQAASPAVSKAAAPSLLPKFTEVKVARPPKIRKMNVKVINCGTATESVNNNESQDIHCAVCKVKMSSKELLEKHKKGREQHRLKERRAK